MPQFMLGNSKKGSKQQVQGIKMSCTGRKVRLSGYNLNLHYTFL
jgi:hypothetical protein